MPLLTLLLVLTLLGYAHAAVCDPQAVAMTVEDEAGALELAAALECSQGIFDVTWVGAVELGVPLAVNLGNALAISGVGNASVLGNDVALGLIYVEGSTSALTLQNVEVRGGASADGGAVKANDGAVVQIVDCTFVENTFTGSGGEKVMMAYKNNVDYMS